MSSIWFDKGANGLASKKGARGAGLQTRLDGFDIAATLGFGCLLTSLLIYSASAMPFQRFETLEDFVTILGTALRACAAGGALVCLATALRRTDVLHALPLRAALAVAFVAGNAMFGAMALMGAWPAWTFWVAGWLMGLGCLGSLLAWGRVLSRYSLRQATGVVAGAAMIAVALGSAQLALPEAGAVALFMLCTTAACALPFALGDCAGKTGHARGTGTAGTADGVGADAGEVGVPGGAVVFGGARAVYEAGSGDLAAGAGRPSESAGSLAAPFASRARAFLDMTLVPGIGLGLFAMLMAVRGQLFFENYTQYVLIQVVVAVLLLVCMLLPASMPLLRTVYRGLIPILAVAVLAFNYMSETIFGGSEHELTLVITLYTVAALLTISTLVGMAHAAEFSSDLVVSIACILFSAVSVITMLCASWFELGDYEVRVLIVVSSGLYAGGMVIYALVRGLRADKEALVGLEDTGSSRREAAPARGAEKPGPAAGASASDELLFDAGVEARCDALARRYGLTAREREVLGYLAHGHNGVYISDELLISPNTVRTHIHNIYRKLDVTSREDIIRKVRG